MATKGILNQTNLAFLSSGVNNITLTNTANSHGTWSSSSGTVLLSGVTDPVSAQDTATKNYVDLRSGVTSVSGTANQIDVSPTTGACVVSIDAAYVGQSSITTLGTLTTGTWNATTIAVNHGGTGVTSVTTAPTASAWAGWDANSNISAINFLPGWTSTVTAAGTTTLVVGSTYYQAFTGTTTQTVLMPVTSTLVLGQSWEIINESTGAVTVQSSGSNTIVVLAPSSQVTVTCILTSGTIAASWSIDNSSSTGGIIPLSSGGTSASLTANLGGIFYSTASQGAILAGTSTAGQMLQSGATAAPSWSTTTWPATTTNHQVLYSTAANTVGGSANFTFDSTVLHLASTTASTSNTTGALTLAGGIGISNTTDASSATNGGSFTTAGGMAVAESLWVGTNETLTGTSSVLSLTGTSSQINMSSTIVSASNNSGSIVTSGGIGISSGTNATSVTNGGTITTAGGVAVALDMYVGGLATTTIASTAVTANFGASATAGTDTVNVASSTAANVQSTAMTPWTASAPDATKVWTSVCWGLNQFVAVSNSGGATAGLVRTSPDGITWTTQTAASTNPWIAVCWAQDIQTYAAAASSGGGNTNVMFSTNGSTWTSSTTIAAQTYTCICRGTRVTGNGTAPPTGIGNVFLIADSNGAAANNQVYTSPTGVTWAAQTVPAAANPGWASCCWSDEVGLFVIVASGGANPGTQIITSPDGINWTASTSANLVAWQSVCWSPTLGLFVAVASSGTAAQQIMYSTVGTGTWLAATAPSAQQWQSVCWSPSLQMFVAVANNGTTAQQIMYSATGTGTWLAATSTSATTWRSICFSNNILGRFVAVANTAVAGNGMYSNNNFGAIYNTTLNLGTLAATNVTATGASVVIYPIPFYYGENTSVITLTGANTYATDITINNVPDGIYMAQIWMQMWDKTGVTASTTESIRIIGSHQGTIFTTPANGTNGVQSMMGNVNTSVGCGSRFFQWTIRSRGTSGYQDISYQIAANAITNATPFTADPGILRTFYLSRLG